MSDTIKKLSKNETIFFELYFFPSQRKARFVFTPLYIVFMFFLTKNNMYDSVLIHLALIILCSSILGIFNIKFLYNFFSENKERFNEAIKSTLDFIEETRGFKKYSKNIFSLRGFIRSSQIINKENKAWRKTKWKSRLYLLLCSIPVFLFTFFIIKVPSLNPMKPSYFILYPLLLF